MAPDSDDHEKNVLPMIKRKKQPMLPCLALVLLVVYIVLMGKMSRSFSGAPLELQQMTLGAWCSCTLFWWVSGCSYS